ncbi:MAG: serine protease [Bacteroidetes bacterium HGW-Bacteroidetes-16]|jgi:membrane-bound serine protease (ClpP class)|nr:MAG: serine protease [Bacteroidetes bacterium HGW-Bacteroidetes-16]
MKKLISITLLLISSFLSVHQEIKANTDSASVMVYTFDMKEMIAPPVWRTTKNAIEKAVEQKADLIVIHMNTYGGTLDDADSIRTKILNSTIPVYIFIDKNAASAGALISIACDSIYMAPGSSIGAATVVNQSGEQMPDKYQSYMRSMMRATAEAKNRDPKIAQAMVDPKVYVPGISDSGQVLTFTVSEAIQHGFCEAKVENLNELLQHAGIQNYEVVPHEISATDNIIGWLINPFVSGILIMLIIGGIYFELQTPGIGFPLAAAFVAAMLYFAPLYLEGLANHWEIIVFIVGVALIAVEIFAIPGFGVIGVLGLVLMIIGLTLSMVGNINPINIEANISQITKALSIVVIAFFLAITVSIMLSKKLFTSRAFGHLALTKTQNVDEGYTSASPDYTARIGQEGIAYTMLRPAGKIMIDNELYDATARSGLIEKGVRIVVVGYLNAQLVVKKL